MCTIVLDFMHVQSTCQTCVYVRVYSVCMYSVPKPRGCTLYDRMYSLAYLRLTRIIWGNGNVRSSYQLRTEYSPYSVLYITNYLEYGVHVFKENIPQY